MTKDPYPELRAAVSLLARRCDSARSQDGKGFSKFDADFGKSLAAQQAWSPKQASAAHRMIRRYRKQLSLAHIDYDAIPEPAFLPLRYADAGQAQAPGLNTSQRSTAVLGSEAKSPPTSRGQVQFNGSLFALSFDYNATLVAMVKALPGHRWDPQTKVWTFPLAAWEKIEEIARTFGFSYSPRAQRALDELKLRSESSSATDADVHIPTLRGTLRPFQRAGVAYLTRAKRAFLADEMGLGKTVQALATLEATDAFPALVICPASLKLNWAREAKQWLPHRPVDILSGRREENPLFKGWPADIVVVNYDLIGHRLEELNARGFQAVIFDECHYLKGHKAARTLAAREIAKDKRIRLMLSGTPLLNRPSELLTQVQVIDRLSDLGGWRDFNQRYLGAAGTTVLQELNRRLRAVCYVRRLKKDVLTELPAKQRTTVPLEIDNRSEYEFAKRELIQWIKQQAAMKGQDVDDAERRALAAEKLVRVEKLKFLAATGKLNQVNHWIHDFLDSGEKLVVFANHIEIQKRIGDHFPGCARILGEDPAAVRQQNVDRFQQDPTCKLIVCSLKAGGVGITLTAASNVAMVEYGWTPADILQAEDRCHRIGQQDSVTSWWLHAENTIEDWMVALLERKAKVIDAATDGTPVAPDQTHILDQLTSRLLA